MVELFHNIVIGEPLCDPATLISANRDDWESGDKSDTLFTTDRYLPSVLKEAGVVPSTSEVKRNRPDLCRTLNQIETFFVNWGKKRIYVIVGR